MAEKAPGQKTSASATDNPKQKEPQTPMISAAKIMKTVSDETLETAFSDAFDRQARRNGVDTYEVVVEEDEKGRHVVVQVSTMAGTPTFDQYALQPELQVVEVILDGGKLSFKVDKVIMRSSFEYNVHYRAR